MEGCLRYSFSRTSVAGEILGAVEEADSGVGNYFWEWQWEVSVVQSMLRRGMVACVVAASHSASRALLGSLWTSSVELSSRALRYEHPGLN